MNTVFITGAGRGLGLEFARQTLSQGHRVFAGVRRPESASELSALGAQHDDRLTILPLDVADPTSIDACGARLEAECDHLDLLINNAGINSMSRGIPDEQKNIRLGTLEPEGMLFMIRVNAIAPVLVTQRLLGLLESSTSARVVNISSWLGSVGIKNSGGNYGYCVSKAALNMLGRTLAMDLKDRDITVLMFNPGWVQTDMGGQKAKLTPEKSVAGILRTTANATIDDTGRFLQWDGTDHPW